MTDHQTDDLSLAETMLTAQHTNEAARNGRALVSIADGLIDGERTLKKHLEARRKLYFWTDGQTWQNLLSAFTTA